MMNKSKRTLIAVSAVLIIMGLSLGARTVEGPGYGYLIADQPAYSLWWAEGAYKVMKSDLVPTALKVPIRIACARNEYEPFLLVLSPKTRLDDIRVAVSDLTGPAGASLPFQAVSVRHVEYVRVEIPTDAAGAAGWWPDPLPPYEGPFSAPAGENHPLWITVSVPAAAKSGEYQGTVTLSGNGWKEAVPIRLTVRNFTLPDKPSVRSSFGLTTDQIRRYHNLETREELEKVVDLYYRDLKDHRLAPANPFELYPIQARFSGIPWEGGEFVDSPVHGGRRALRISDNDRTRSIDARSTDPIAVSPGVPYNLSFWAKTDSPDQDYTILLEAITGEGAPLIERNILKVFKGTADWKREVLEIKSFAPGVASIRVRLFPAFRDSDGVAIGTAVFDDLLLARTDAPTVNLLAGGDFEMPIEGLNVAADFSAFDRAARRYLDEFGFNSFDLLLDGLGTGSFYSRREGRFGGFLQGSPEYDKLLSQYLHQIESHLAAHGWLGREYIYWFDEPDPKDYPFVREGMLNIRKNAPKLTRFITEHRPGPEIMDVTEIGCTIFDRVDPKITAERTAKGREFWSYLCTGPQGPWVSLFIDRPAINLRMWLWMSYAWNLKGVLVWRADYWNSASLNPPEVLQNPWADPMSYMVGYGVPFGQPNHWGNGDGRFLYPPNRDPNRDKRKYLGGPIDSLRWEILREGLEDYEYFVLLEKAARNAPQKRKALIDEANTLLKFPPTLFTSGKDYTKDPRALLDQREKIAALIEKFGL
jgi:hypothetical protein